MTDRAIRSEGIDPSRVGDGSDSAAVRSSIAQALARLEQAGKGVLVATDGVRDLRLLAERGSLTLEAKGTILAGGPPLAAIQRALEGAVFWDSVNVDADPGGTVRRGAALTQVRHAGEVAHLLRDLKNGVAARESHRRRIPSFGIVVERQKLEAAGPTPAGKLRAALAKEPKAEALLQDVVKKAGLDEADGGAAIVELLEKGEAKVVRRTDPAFVQASLDASTKGLEDGLCSGLRQERLARITKDPKPAARLWRDAGEARLAAHRTAEAAEDLARAVQLSPEDVVARESLIRALELSGTSKEARFAAEELGKLYLELNLPGRAGVHLARAATEGSPAIEDLLIRAYAGSGAFEKAVERSEQLASKLDQAGRRRLAERLLQTAVRGPTRERALKLGGFDKERQLALSLVGGAGFLVLLTLLFAWEGMARKAYASAATATKARLAKGTIDPTVAEAFEQVASRYAPAPAASRAHAVAQALQDLAADEALLERRGQDLVVRNTDDLDQAQERLEKFVEDARSEGLRLQARSVVTAFERRRQGLTRKLTDMKSMIANGDSLNAIDLAKRLLVEWPGIRNQLREIRIPIRIDATPQAGTVFWNETKVGTTPVDVLLPAAGVECVLRVTSTEMKPFERRVSVDSLQTASIRVAFEQDPVAIAARKLPPSTRPATTDPKKPKIKFIDKEGSVAPSTPQNPRDVKGGTYVIADASAQLLRAATGTAVEVEASDAFFNFMKGKIPERHRFVIELLVEARDKKLFFSGLRVHIEDLALGRKVPPKTIDHDECERPLARTITGGFKVFTLSRTVNLRAEALREKVADAMEDLQAAIVKMDHP